MLRQPFQWMTLVIAMAGTAGPAAAQRITDAAADAATPPARLVSHAEATELPRPAVAHDPANHAPANHAPALVAGPARLTPVTGDGGAATGHCQACQSCTQPNCYGSCYHQFATELQPEYSPPRRRPQIIKRIWQADQQYFQSQVTPPCPGHFVNQFMEVQKANGRLAQYVFYGFHFHSLDVDQQAGLTKSGRTKVIEIARIWQLTPGPIYLMPSGDPQVDQTRLQAAVQALTQQGLPISPDYVVLADPSGPSLMGVEANQFFLQRLQGSPLNPVMGTQGGGAQSTVGGGNATRGGGR